MKYQVTVDENLGETRVSLTSNCYTDAFPMVKTIVFRKQDIDISSQSLPLAVAILTADYCGEQFEFEGVRIGNDYADAIRRVIGRNVNVLGVDGRHRTISAGEVDILCEKASANRRADPVRRPEDTTAFARLDWSGDFVDREQRSSKGSAQGSVHTNAGFFADEAAVSVALALLYGRDKARTIYVPADDTSPEDLAPIRSALRSVAVNLQTVH